MRSRLHHEFRLKRLSATLLAVLHGAGFAEAADLTTTLDNTGQTLYIGAGGADAGLNMAGGTIIGGTIQSDYESQNLFTQDNSNGALDGVTLNGSLDVTGYGARAIIMNGITVNDASGAGPGTINVTGENFATLDFYFDHTLDNAHLNVGTGSIYGEGSVVRVLEGALTLGSNLITQTNGLAHFLGSKITNQGQFFVQSGDVIFYNQGEIFGNSSSMVFDNEGILSIGGGTILNFSDLITNNGQIKGSGFLHGNLVNEGTVAPGDLGPLTLIGNYTETNSSVLDIRVSGEGLADSFAIQGDASFAGKLKIGNQNGYVPQVGDLLTLATFYHSNGGFSTLDTSAYRGVNFQILYNDNDISLKVTDVSGLVKTTLNNIGHTLYIGSGQPNSGLNMAGGTIVGGIIQSDNESKNLFTNDFANGRLDGVSLNGSLDITGVNADATITNGINLHDSTGSGSGTINLTGDRATLNFSTDQTLDHATLNIGPSGNNYPNRVVINPGTTLTLGSNFTTRTNGEEVVFEGIGSFNNRGQILAQSRFTDIKTDTFNNKGDIIVSEGAALILDSNIASNSGNITGSNGSHVQLDANSGSFTNNASGTITMNGAGGDTVLVLGEHWSNDGVINLTQTTLVLEGYFSTADIGTLYRAGGSVRFSGYLDNTSSTLNIGSAQALNGLIMGGGAIVGGTIQSDANSHNLFTQADSYGILDGVTLNGSLDITGYRASATIKHEINLHDAEGTGAGTINLTGDYATLHFDSDQTFAAGTVINLGSTSGTTLGGAGSVTNQGTIAVASGNAAINPVNFINEGTITGADGTSLTLVNAFTNKASGQINMNGNIVLGSSGSTLYNNGTIDGGIISGSGFILGGGSYQNLTMQDVAHIVGGSFSGVNFNGTNVVDDNGYAVLTGTNTNTGSLKITSQSQVFGDGVLNQTAGSIVVDGTLSQSAVNILAGSLSGTGTVNTTAGLAIGTGATLHPGTLGQVGSLSVGGDVTFSGGTLDVALGGTGVGDFSQLSVNGGVNFSNGSSSSTNTVSFELDNGYTPKVGDSVSFLSASNGVNINSNMVYEVKNPGGGSYLLNVADANNSLTLMFVDPALPANPVIDPGTTQVAVGQLANDTGSVLTNLGNLQLPSGSSLTGGGIVDQNGGTLTVDGVLTQNTVNMNGGTLNGTGTLNADLNVVSGHVAPGHSPGTLVVNGDLNLQSGSNLDIELAGLSLFDQVQVSQTATLGGALNLFAVGGYTPVVGDSFDFLTYAAVLGSFDSVNLYGFEPGLTASLSEFSDHLRVSFSAAPVPVPPALWLFGSALAAIGVVNRRRAVVVEEETV